jgi:DNA-binding NarL/FixJ family response regulator
MINSKDILLGVFGYKTNASESTVIEWDEVRYSNPEHVKALLHFSREYDGIEDLKYIIIDFYELLDSLVLTKLQKEILELVQRDKTVTDIAKILKVTRKTVYHNIDSVVNRICQKAKQD